VSGLDKENQERQWERIKFLMTDDFTTTKALGWIDAERMKKTTNWCRPISAWKSRFAVETRSRQAARSRRQDGRKQGQEVRQLRITRHARPCAGYPRLCSA